MTGDVVGTPQYMPPESFDGTYDVKSEIYGVGLTMYELFTGRPAIEGKSPADVIRKATAGVCVSPRKLNSHVPRDLETIVLKALAHDPRARYVTAGELRDDLRAVLNRPADFGAANEFDRTHDTMVAARTNRRVTDLRDVRVTAGAGSRLCVRILAYQRRIGRGPIGQTIRRDVASATN